MTLRCLLACLCLFAFSGPAFAEDGHDLWLRYRPLAGAAAHGIGAGQSALAPLPKSGRA